MEWKDKIVVITGSLRPLTRTQVIAYLESQGRLSRALSRTKHKSSLQGTNNWIFLIQINAHKSIKQHSTVKQTAKRLKLSLKMPSLKQ